MRQAAFDENSRLFNGEDNYVIMNGFNCTVLREVAGNDSDEVEIIRRKGTPP